MAESTHDAAEWSAGLTDNDTTTGSRTAPEEAVSQLRSSESLESQSLGANCFLKGNGGWNGHALGDEYFVLNHIWALGCRDLYCTIQNACLYIQFPFKSNL